MFLAESGLLKTLKVREAIVSFGRHTEIWLPDGRDEACSVIGKFTQGSRADGKRLTMRLVIDQGELDFPIRNIRQSGTLVGAPQKCPLGHILRYCDGPQPQYTHLRVSMLAHAHINLLSMLSRFTLNEAVQVATDIIYVRKSALKRLEHSTLEHLPTLEGVEAFITMKKMRLPSLLAREEYLPAVAQAQWRDKDEELYMPVEHAAYLTKPDYKANTKRTSLPAPHRQRQNHASDRAFPPERSPSLHPDPSPGQRDADQGRPGQDLPQLLPMEWPDGVDA